MTIQEDLLITSLIHQISLDNFLGSDLELSALKENPNEPSHSSMKSISLKLLG